MAKEIDLLSYWMPLLKALKEFQEIAKSEELELRHILEACEKALNDMYLETATEDGVSRIEKIAGIISSDEDDLEARRFKILTKYNDKVPYSEKELENRLTSLCGDNYTVIKDYANYLIFISTQLDIQGAFDLFCDTIRGMIPCNMVLNVENVVSKSDNMDLYYAGASSITEIINS